MKKSITLALAFVFAAFGVALAHQPVQGTEIKPIDTENSTVKWKGYKVTGSHYGTVDVKSGKLEMRDGKLVGGRVIIAMKTIKDLDLEGEYNTKLVNHLKSDDFFGVEKFPEAAFTINRAVEAADGEYTVTGDLTIKKNTHPIKFTAYLKDGIATAKIKVDRAKYDVRYGSGSFFDNLGDKTIYDEFDLEVKLAY